MKYVPIGLAIGIISLLGVPSSVNASPNDFRFTAFEADYYLDKDNDGRSTLKTVEKLTAEFPAYDQNHGIERAIPKSYDGHTTNLKVQSVTNEAGQRLDYTAYEQQDNLVLRIGEAATYVHGQKTYVITYTQRDVTKYFSDTNDDEFYWDTNGTQWAQPFGSVTARVHLGDAVMSKLNNKFSCYKGVQGSTKTCDANFDGAILTANTANLSPYENMSVSIGFAPGTFHGYEMSTWDKLLFGWLGLQLLTSGIGLFYAFWLPYKYSQKSSRTSELQPVAPEYIPPRDASVLVSSQIGEGTRAETTAQIIDLAVRHYISITETKEKSLWQPAEYELKIVKPVDKLLQEEQDFVQTLFGSLAVGTTLETKSLKNNYKLFTKLHKNSTQLGENIKGQYGLRAKDDETSAWFRKYGKRLLIFAVVTLSPIVLIAVIVAYACGWVIKPLTDKGLVLRRYLAGLKDYISLAEKDRLIALQSPEGAEKSGVVITGDTDKKLVKLYERTLPYAVLFGQEKEWNKQLALQYENSGTQPDWFVGHGAFNAAAFSSSMSGFASSMNSYGASSSSSSGGSGGGGSSGGGGGGGGGGGW